MKSPKLYLAFLLAAVCAVHGGAVKNAFYWDDIPNVLSGQQIRSIRSIPSLFTHEFWHNVDLGKQAPTVAVDTFRPLLNLSFLVDYQLWGPSAPGFHFSNLLFHLLNIALLFAAVSVFFPAPVALFSAAIFGLHPLASEPVHYVSARGDSLMLLFALLATWIGFDKNRKPAVAAAGIGFFYLCSALAKESALLFPLVWVFMFAAEEKGQWRQVARRSLPLAAAALFYFALRFNALGSMKAVRDTAQIQEVFLNFPRFVSHFFLSFLVPVFNMPMQDFPVIRPPAALLAWISAGSFYLLCAALAVRFYRASFAVPLFGLVLLLLPPFFATSLTEVANPRYLYAALAPAAVSVALLIGGRRIPALLGIAALIGLGVQSHATAAHYRTEEGFYRRILEQFPRHTEAEYNLANTLVRAGRWEEAAVRYRNILRTDPKHASALNNLGVALLRMGRPVEAIPYFEKAVSLRPDTERYRNNLALAKKQRKGGGR